ncbi:uncharacterized protein LOC123265194 isoform X1 [Cotesia glomerata]|uniref:Secreted protein n=1 Tax=Cotesia glomerata TaxID=32391 RepID=A0AAV7J2X7_COTGL|nr:uncharacterized protein LOC123265194 isoform X1 [Cotesia glomerata]XP_044584786.1 uncharacterized protein LOC123265194 isoform X1 [Cotesia glomerata]XP_044584787.1 uncharacterized protein LOC123265194 isoform X1 [Cotesia glomerata]KAH0561746.1 hypothetical protein KQX54_019210 [Cotesia glomerata]
MQGINFFISFAVLLLLKSSSGALNHEPEKEITPLELPSGERNFDIVKEYSEEIPLEDMDSNMLQAHPRIVRQVEAPKKEYTPITSENSKDDQEDISLELLDGDHQLDKFRYNYDEKKN